MYIQLLTYWVWELSGELAADKFFLNLPLIAHPEDVLVIGSYLMQPPIKQWLIEHETEISGGKPFDDDSFTWNRGEYPEGRSYALRCEPEILEALANFSREPKGGVEKDDFFDHIVIYREAEPRLPLLNAHNAFLLPIQLSGHYSKATVESFAQALNTSAEYLVNAAYRD